MIKLELGRIGKTLGLRLMGKPICEQIISAIERDEKVILDFNGVTMLTDSCADEIFTTLIHKYGFDKFKRYTGFLNYNSQIEKMILNKIQYAISTQPTEKKDLYS